MSKSVASGGAQNDGYIGDIIPSMLTEAQFQSQRGSGWVLMDGRSVGGSKYQSVTGNNTIPDARGAFLRAKNNGRSDGNQNPDGELVLGTFENDEFQGHNHQWISTASTAGNNGQGGILSSGLVSSSVTTGDVIGDPITDGINGTPRVGSETRPKNITVNYFIKIN